jgi:acyl carrier protein
LETQIAQITAAKVNWNIFKPIYEIKGTRSLLKQLGTQTTTQHWEEKESNELPQLLQKLEQTPDNKRHDVLLESIRSEIARVLGLAQAPAIKQGFIELGMDSLMAVELKNRLESQLGCSLSSTLMFNYPNIEELVNYLAKEVLAWEQPSEVVEHNKTARDNNTSSEIDGLSEDELALLLDEELKMAV